jgi:hypothetical protein
MPVPSCRQLTGIKGEAVPAVHCRALDSKGIRQMKRLLAIGAAGLMASALAGSPAMAQAGYGFGPGFGMMPGYGPGMMTGRGWGYGPGMMDQPGRGRFTMIDANEDGVVSAEEAASAADEVFTAMDADDDGSLTKEEYMTIRMGPQLGYNPERQAARQKAKEDRFAAMDADGNGSVSKEEFMAAAQAHHASADADGDGKVSPWEHRGRNWN